MNFDPILSSKLTLYKKNYGIESLGDNDAFEMFVNSLILRTYQPEAFSAINDLFDHICVGGQNDTGIDGLAIKVNGVFVGSKQDIDDILKRNNKIAVEFFFIQSKYKKNLDSSEYGKFMDGIVDFLSEQHYEPHNAKISGWIDLKEYICSEDVLVRWEKAPDIKIYYAYTGEWREDLHILAKFERAKATIGDLGLYEGVENRILDGAKLKKICDDIDNQFRQVITIVDSLELNEAPSVESSRVLLCSADNFIKLLIDEDGNLRRALFKDNVRDYQGNTDINEEILSTIQNAPTNFCLLNNGITVVCKSMIPGNRKISIENPQIVNGCQTCNTIYNAYKKNIDISSVTLLVKLIATNNTNVTNAIVKGTNRQNIVYDEAFEITRTFHKNFEDYIDTIQSDTDISEKIYYERRANQYASLPSIKAHQKASFKLLIQSFVSTILQSPHEGFIHDSTLLSTYRNQIFIDGQSFLPYYLAIYLFLKVDRLFKADYNQYRFISTYKHHILCILVEEIAGPVPDINNTKRIDAYCEKIFTAIKDETTFLSAVAHAIATFNKIKSAWIKDNGNKMQYAIKDNSSFTKYMLTHIRGGNLGKILDEEAASNCRGRVVTVKKDRNNLAYGYIKSYPSDVFIHEDDNPHIRFYDLYGKDVVYTIMESGKYNTPRGKILYIIKE